MSKRKDDLSAAPPDDGHMGSMTKPGDTLQTSDPDEPKSPALSQDQQGQKSGSQSVPGLILIGIVLIFIVAVVMGLL